MPVTARIHIAAAFKLVVLLVNLLELFIIEHKRCAWLRFQLELVYASVRTGLKRLLELRRFVRE